LIIWVKDEPGGTVLKGYDHKLRNVVTMREIDDGENWQITHYKEVHTMRASGCPDPVDFIMRLISPRNEDTHDDLPFLMFSNFDTGENIEVWEMI
jgi:hypothetical protein